MRRTGFDRLVVGVDGSETALRAVAWAAERLAPDSGLHVVHASDSDRDRATTQAQLEGDWSLPARAAGVEVYYDLVDDDPDRALLAIADRTDADAVIVGAHGSGGAGHRSPFLGSVTRGLLSETRRPLIVHKETPAGNGGSVIACVGYGPPAEAAAEWAADHAARMNRPLVLLHAVSHRPIYPLDSPLDMLASYLGADVDVSWATEDLDSLREELMARDPDLDVTTSVLRGSAINAILDAGRGDAVTGAAELVVLGRWLNPATSLLPPSPRLHQLIARAACPTAIVPTCQTTDDR